jgi:thymidylate synthase
MVRKLGIVEALQFLSGYFDERHIDSCVHLQYPYGIANAYGMKVAQQLPKVLAQLEETPDSRRATLYIGKPEDGQEETKPCMQMLQYQIRNGELHTGLFARSWDAISGLPYDVTMFNIVSQVMAKLLGVKPYGLSAIAGSVHYYKEAYVRVSEKYGASVPNAPYSIVRVLRDFADYQEARNWAIDQLNQLELWTKGLPEGIISI